MTDIEICEKIEEQDNCVGVTCRECPLSNNDELFSRCDYCCAGGGVG